MKLITTILLVFVAIFSIGCDKCNEGETVAPPSFFVEIRNENNENVFANETFTKTQITIQNAANELVPFQFITNNNTIQIFPNTKILESNSFVITLNNPETFQQETVAVSCELNAAPEECFIRYTMKTIQFPTNEATFLNGIYILKL